jgi:hypothetical protein
MHFRTVKFLILACIAFWATGAAQYAHECIEHGAGGYSEEAKATRPAGPAWDNADPDDGDCPTCIMLASMASERAVPPVLPDLVGSCIDILIVCDRPAPVLTLLRFEPARGPPVDPSILAT